MPNDPVLPPELEANPFDQKDNEPFTIEVKGQGIILTTPKDIDKIMRRDEILRVRKILKAPGHVLHMMGMGESFKTKLDQKVKEYVDKFGEEP